MLNRLTDNLFSRLQIYFDPARLGPILAKFLINLGIAVFILARFYGLGRMVNTVL
jgi:hypothetical protein